MPISPTEKKANPINSTTAILACDVFRDEVKALMGLSPTWHSIRWLAMGLHDHPANLRREVQNQITEIESDPKVARIVLIYGMCGGGLVGVAAQRCELILPQAHDCISLLLGSATKHQQVLTENPATYFYSPGWIRGKRVPGPDREAYLRELYGPRYPDDPDIVEDLIEADQETFAHHNTAAYVDLTGNAEARSYCEGCALHQGWDFNELATDDAWLRSLLNGPWNAPHFLTVAPGQKISLGTGGPRPLSAE
jgi:hypothetical protein